MVPKLSSMVEVLIPVFTLISWRAGLAMKYNPIEIDNDEVNFVAVSLLLVRYSLTVKSMVFLANVLLKPCPRILLKFLAIS